MAKVSDILEFDAEQFGKMSIDGVADNRTPEEKYYQDVYNQIKDCTNHQEIYEKIFEFLIGWCNWFFTNKNKYPTIKTLDEFYSVKHTANQFHDVIIPTDVIYNPKYDLQYLTIHNDIVVPISFSLNINYEKLQKERLQYVKMNAFNINPYKNLIKKNEATSTDGIDQKLRELIQSIETEKLLVNGLGFHQNTQKDIVDYLFSKVKKLSSSLFDEIYDLVKRKAKKMMSKDKTVRKQVIETFGNLFKLESKSIELLKKKDIKYFFEKAKEKIERKSRTETIINKRIFLENVLPFEAVRSGFKRKKTEIIEMFGKSNLTDALNRTYTTEDYKRELDNLVGVLIRSANELLKKLPLKCKTDLDAKLLRKNSPVTLYDCGLFQDFIEQTPRVSENFFLKYIDQKDRFYDAKNYWMRFKRFRLSGRFENKQKVKFKWRVNTDQLLFGPRPIIRILKNNKTKALFPAIPERSVILFLFPDNDANQSFYLKPNDPTFINTQARVNWKIGTDGTLGRGFPLIKFFKQGNLEKINFSNSTLSFSNLSEGDETIQQTSLDFSSKLFEENNIGSNPKTYYKDFFNLVLQSLDIKILDIGFYSTGDDDDDDDYKLDCYPIEFDKRVGKNYHVYFKYNDNNSNDKLLTVATWENYGFGGSTAFRTDKVDEDLDYIWNYTGDATRGIELGMALGLNKNSYIHSLEKDFTVGPIEDKTDGTQLTGAKTINYPIRALKSKADGRVLVYMKVELPILTQGGLKDGSKIHDLFKFEYYRRIMYDESQPNHLQIYKLLEGAKYQPNIKKYNFDMVDNKYIFANPPINTNTLVYQDSNTNKDKGTRVKIKNKGNIVVENKRTKSAGDVMGPIKSFISKTELTQNIGSTTISATNFAYNIVNSNNSTKSDWKKLKVPEKARENNRFLASQDWCHLMAAGLGGQDAMGNLVSGSAYCNSEQLAMELAIMNEMKSHPPNTFMLKVTAYLLKNNSLNSNYLTKQAKSDAPNQYDYIQNAYQINKTNNPNQKSHTGKDFGENEKTEFDENTFENAPIAAFIRYKIYKKNNAGTYQQVMDYTMEGQSEFFDVHQSKIINIATRFLLSGDDAEFQEWYDANKAT